MPPDDKARVEHMLAMANALVLLTAGRRREDMTDDIRLSLAVERALEVLGEAAARLSGEWRTAAPDVPWREIISMRNRLAHAYFVIDPNIMWDTATLAVPAIVAPLGRLLDGA